MFIFICLLSLCVCVSFSSELCSLHHWRWKCYFDRCIKVPGQGLCRCVFLWLAPNTIVFFFLIASRDCVCFWWNPFIVCVHVNIYWQLALITCQSHSSLPQGPITHKERWFVVTQVCTSLDFLFVFAPKKKKGILLWQQLPEVFGQPLLHWHRIGHWLCGQCERIQRDCFFPSCMLTFFSDNTKPNNTSSHINAVLHSSGTKCHLNLTCNWSAHSF